MLAALTLLLAPASEFEKDLDSLLADLRSFGAYVQDDGIDFARLDAAYRPRFVAAQTKRDLLPVLEALVGELHDWHAFIGTSTGGSPRLVPSGTDLYGVWDGERAVIEQVRPGTLAAENGLLPGDTVLTIDGLPAREAARKQLGTQDPGKRGWEWALNAALAGRWGVPRKLTWRHGSEERSATFATARDLPKKGLLTLTRKDGLLILRPEDSLGDTGLIDEFDRLRPDLESAKGIVLDLRNTPSGGNTTVARGILGRFASDRRAYQRHMLEERETSTVRDWVEYVTPRGPKPIRTPLVVLVDRWTGSMGEGMAIGFNAMKRATVIGTRMAGLRGAVDNTTLPASGFRVFFPTERLFHVNGTPRHEWVPPVKVKPGAGDPWMAAAERTLRR